MIKANAFFNRRALLATPGTFDLESGIGQETLKRRRIKSERTIPDQTEYGRSVLLA
ncbi:MAG: hypothetical protein ACYCYL_10000 [Acidithiobacillus sp.]